MAGTLLSAEMEALALSMWQVDGPGVLDRRQLRARSRPNSEIGPGHTEYRGWRLRIRNHRLISGPNGTRTRYQSHDESWESKEQQRQPANKNN